MKVVRSSSYLSLLVKSIPSRMFSSVSWRPLVYTTTMYRTRSDHPLSRRTAYRPTKTTLNDIFTIPKSLKQKKQLLTASKDFQFNAGCWYSSLVIIAVEWSLPFNLDTWNTVMKRKATGCILMLKAKCNQHQL